MTRLLLLLLVACAKESTGTEPPVNGMTEAPPPETPATGDPERVRTGEAGPGETTNPGETSGSGTVKNPPAFGGNINVSADPKGAFEVYRERLESPEAAGECQQDADCAPAGCSKEVCAPASAEINTTCDVLPVFTVLDACGCVETKCQWSIKE